MHIAIGTIAILLGLIAGVSSAFLYWAGMMSDNNDSGSQAASEGCVGVLIGAVLFGFGIWMVL